MANDRLMQQGTNSSDAAAAIRTTPLALDLSEFMVPADLDFVDFFDFNFNIP